MNYEIKGTPFPVVICKLANGERMITEKGAMVWMSPNMEMSTVGGGLGRMFSKAFSGESHVSEHLHRPRRRHDHIRLLLSRPHRPPRNCARDANSCSRRARSSPRLTA